MSDTSSTHFPALRHLENEFNEHMKQFRDGIETAEDLLYWSQRTSVLTLGYIESDALVALFDDPYASNAAILSQPLRRGARRDYGRYEVPDESTTKETDKQFRLEYEATVLTPAFRKAYTSLKKHASEYVESSSNTVNTEDKSPALRPSIEELFERQRGVLDDMLQDGGFDSREDLLEWSRDLIAATRGNIPDEEIDNLAFRFKTPIIITDALLGQTSLEEATRYRFIQMVAAMRVLPYFNIAVRDIAQTAKETKDLGTQDDGSTVGV